ncbi:hypothetical protein, partial [Marinitenerispora sediminis]
MFRATAAILRRPWARAVLLMSLLAVQFLCQWCHAQAVGAHDGAAKSAVAVAAAPAAEAPVCAPEAAHGHGAGEAHPCDTVEAVGADSRMAAGKLLLLALAGTAAMAAAWLARPSE